MSKEDKSPEMRNSTEAGKKRFILKIIRTIKKNLEKTIQRRKRKRKNKGKNNLLRQCNKK